MPLPPPLLVSPVDHLTKEDREAFEKKVAEIGRAEEGDTIACLFPLALYHRIDGIWLPVSDLGAFHAPANGDTGPKEPVESSYRPDWTVDKD